MPASWPDWWTWEIELSPHVLKRMIDRQFNEADLRLMLEDAEQWRDDVEPDRFVVISRHQGAAWEIIVEPLEAEKRLLVVTAYAPS